MEKTYKKRVRELDEQEIAAMRKLQSVYEALQSFIRTKSQTNVVIHLQRTTYTDLESDYEQSS